MEAPRRPFTGRRVARRRLAHGAPTAACSGNLAATDRRPARRARIFAQPLKPKKGSVYNASWSVQKHGTLIVRRLKTSNAKGQRIWFDASLKRVETDGWVFAEAPQAFAGVRVVNGKTAWEADSIEPFGPIGPMKVRGFLPPPAGCSATS